MLYVKTRDLLSFCLICCCSYPVFFFRWDISVICPIMVLKFDEIVFTRPYFQTRWPNWLNFFSVIKKIRSMAEKINPAGIHVNIYANPWFSGKQRMVSEFWIARLIGQCAVAQTVRNYFFLLFLPGHPSQSDAHGLFALLQKNWPRLTTGWAPCRRTYETAWLLVVPSAIRN